MSPFLNVPRLSPPLVGILARFFLRTLFAEVLLSSCFPTAVLVIFPDLSCPPRLPPLLTLVAYFLMPIRCSAFPVFKRRAPGRFCRRIRPVLRRTVLRIVLGGLGLYGFKLVYARRLFRFFMSWFQKCGGITIRTARGRNGPGQKDRNGQGEKWGRKL